MSAAYTAGRAAFNDPLGASNSLTAQTRETDYGIAWLYYTERMFSLESGDWDAYRSARGLYLYTRLIFNPIPSIVAFYEDNIFAPADESNVLDDGTQLITNVFDQTPDALKAAIAQLDLWGNWQSECVRAVRFGSTTGNVLIEVEDDIEREWVSQNIHWPSVVKSLELDRVGNVKSYAIEFTVQDVPNKTQYTFRKEVDSELFKYFRDGKPFTPEGKEAPEVENQYGFVPAVWVRHINDGGDYGRPAFGNINKVNELNSLASHTHDHIHKAIESHKIIATDGSIIPITGASGSSSQSGGNITIGDIRTNWMLLKAPMGTAVLDLAGTLKLAEADPYLERTLKSFANDCPELQAGQIIQENSQLSGAALERMLGPAQKKLDRACASYFAQIIKLRQMQIAIAGWRANSDWRQKTVQQAKFAPFNLESYAKGDLNFGIKRSLLVQATEAENEDLMLKKATRATTLEPIVDEQEALRIAGYSEADAKAIAARKRTADVIPTEAQ